MTDLIGSPPKRLRARSLMAAAWLAMLLVAAGPVVRVYACSCDTLITPEAKLATASAAFVGVVAGVQDNVEAGKGVGEVVASITYSIVVEEALKGGWSAGDVAQVRSESGTCSVFFAVGQRWRVFTYLSGPGHVTSICSGNELMAEGVPIPESAGGSGNGIPIGLVVMLGSTVLVGAISIWAFTRRDHSTPA